MVTIIPVLVDRAPVCPGCGRALAVIQGDAVPAAGDWNICAHCLTVLRFTGEGFDQRTATLAELEACVAAGEMEDEGGLALLRRCFAARGGPA